MAFYHLLFQIIESKIKVYTNKVQMYITERHNIEETIATFKQRDEAYFHTTLNENSKQIKDQKVNVAVQNMKNHEGLCSYCRV